MRGEMTRLVRLRLMLVLSATVLVATAAITVPSGGRAASTSGDCTPGAGWGTLWPDLVNQVLALTNAHRAQYGLVPLSVSQTLTDAAVWKALLMSRYGYMAHDDPAPPVARTSAERFEACGYPIAAASWGENIAYGYATAAAVVAAWLASPGHRANLEQPAFDEIGIAVATSPAGVHYWAQAFGSSDARNGGPP